MKVSSEEMKLIISKIKEFNKKKHFSNITLTFIEKDLVTEPKAN